MQVDIPRTGQRMALSPSLLAGWTQLLPILVAIIGTSIVFLVLKYLLSPDSGVYALLFERGFLQPVSTALFFWGLGHVIRRALRQIGEHSAIDEGERFIRQTELKPSEITPLMHSLSPLKASLVGPILSNLLSYFTAYRPSRDEVMQVAGQQLDWAQDRIDAEYKPLNATMWLLPLSGFIGTLVGMSGAVSGFRTVLESGHNAFSDLGPAMDGLTTAFDTTLLALLFVIPLKLCEVLLHHRDQVLMHDIDEAVGTGFVRGLDLGVMAQQSPEEAALDRFADGMSRVDETLEQIDETLAQIIGRLQTLPRVDELANQIREASKSTIDHLPQIQRELDLLRQLNAQPITLTRAPVQQNAALHSYEFEARPMVKADGPALNAGQQESYARPKALQRRSDDSDDLDDRLDRSGRPITTSGTPATTSGTPAASDGRRPQGARRRAESPRNAAAQDDDADIPSDRPVAKRAPTIATMGDPELYKRTRPVSLRIQSALGAEGTMPNGEEPDEEREMITESEIVITQDQQNASSFLRTVPEMSVQASVPTDPLVNPLRIDAKSLRSEAKAQDVVQMNRLAAERQRQMIAKTGPMISSSGERRPKSTPIDANMAKTAPLQNPHLAKTLPLSSPLQIEELDHVNVLTDFDDEGADE